MPYPKESGSDYGVHRVTMTRFYTCVLILGLCLRCVSSQVEAEPPAPWPALRVLNKSHVSVWGRRYEFADGPLPTRITSAGRNLLAAPVALELDAGRSKITWDAPTLHHHDTERAQLVARGTSPGTRWSATTEVTYDGLIWITVRAAPENAAARLDRLSLVMIVSHGPLYSHQLVRTGRISPNWKQHFTEDPDRLWDAGLLPAGGWSGQFTPQLWVGDHRSGLSFLAEGPQRWSLAMDQQIMAVKPLPDGTACMRVDFVSQPLRLTEPWTIQFGLMATPVRPPVLGIEPWRLLSTGGRPLAEQIRDFAPADFNASRLHQLHDQGVKVVLLWSEWTDLWGFPDVRSGQHAEFVERFVDYAHRLGIKVLPYLCPFLAYPDNHPQFNEHQRRFLFSTEKRADIFHPENNSYRVTPTPEFTRWYLDQIRNLVKRFHFDGVYLDTIAKVDQPLQDDRCYYALREWRRLYEGIYRIFHGELRADGLVLFHDSEPNLAMLNAFADMRLCGEMQYFAAVARKKVLPLVPDLEERMPLDSYYVWTSGHLLGNIPSYWIVKPPMTKTYSVGAGTASSSSRVSDILTPDETFALSTVCGTSLLCSPEFRGNWSPAPRMFRLWQLEKPLLDQGAIRFGYWQAAKYFQVRPPKHTAVGGLVVPGRAALLTVANLKAHAATIEVAMNPESGLGGRELSARMEMAGGSAWVESRADTIRLHLSSNAHAVIFVQRE